MGLCAAATPLVALTHGLLGILMGPSSAGSAACSSPSSFRSSISASGKAQCCAANRRLGHLPARPRRHPGLFIDGALTASFDETRALLIALVWLAALATAATLLFRHTATGRW
jgi:hypothetical protein